MSSFVHEAFNGNEWEFYLNEASGVVTFCITAEDNWGKPAPVSIYNGSLAYPALPSGFNTQLFKLQRIQRWFIEIHDQYQQELITARTFIDDNMKFTFGYTATDGYTMKIVDLNSWEHVVITEQEIEDVLCVVIDWFDRTIKWSEDIKESVL